MWMECSPDNTQSVPSLMVAKCDRCACTILKLVDYMYPTAGEAVVSMVSR